MEEQKEIMDIHQLLLDITKLLGTPLLILLKANEDGTLNVEGVGATTTSIKLILDNKEKDEKPNYVG